MTTLSTLHAKVAKQKQLIDKQMAFIQQTKAANTQLFQENESKNRQIEDYRQQVEQLT